MDVDEVWGHERSWQGEVVVGGCQRKTEFDFLVFSGIIPDKKYL